jgi:hypothetical protein
VRDGRHTVADVPAGWQVARPDDPEAELNLTDVGRQLAAHAVREPPPQRQLGREMLRCGPTWGEHVAGDDRFDVRLAQFRAGEGARGELRAAGRVDPDHVVQGRVGLARPGREPVEDDHVLGRPVGEPVVDDEVVGVLVDRRAEVGGRRLTGR